MKYWLLFALFISFSGHTQDAKYYVTAESSAMELAALQQQAKDEDKLLMLVLGADWCHDSRALMAHFQQPEFAPKLAERYVVQAIDVGYLEYGFFVANAFGAPTYYGTPTVMIIDPSAGQIINKGDWQQWTNAAAQSAETYDHYFLQQQFTALAQTPENLAFERSQAARVREGYTVVGPLLEAYMTRDGAQAPAEFSTFWKALADFRNGVFEDVVEYQTATAGFPNYPQQPWEQVKE